MSISKLAAWLPTMHKPEHSGKLNRSEGPDLQSDEVWLRCPSSLLKELPGSRLRPGWMSPEESGRWTPPHHS